MITINLDKEMKRILFNIILMLVPLMSWAQHTPTQFFKGTFAQALAKARQENKHVMVDCYTLWCGPCRHMSANVFPNDTLGAYLNERFVCMQLDMEHGEGPERNKAFKVNAYPTFIVFDATGKELNRFSGMMPKERFISRCDRILKGLPPVDENAEREEDSPQVARQADKAADAVQDEGKGVAFISGSDARWSDILAKAKQEDKRIFVDFWADWCGACKKMDATAFKDTRIGNMLNHTFVNYSVNMDKDPDGKMLVDKYGVQAFPTYLIVNPDGTEFNRILGSHPIEDFGHAVADALMGKEDQTVKMMRLQREAEQKARQERQAKLTDKPQSAPASKVKFEKSLDIQRILKTAAGQKKMVLLYVSDGDWRSDYMTKYTFNEQEAADYLNARFVNVYVDANSRQGDALVTRFKVDERFPSIVILDSKGNVEGILPGMLKKPSILKSTIDSVINNNK